MIHFLYAACIFVIVVFVTLFQFFRWKDSR